MSPKKLWPTPNASDVGRTEFNAKNRLEQGHQQDLATVVMLSETPESSKTSQLSLLPEESLASLQVSPGSSEARKMTAGSGAKLSGLFKNSGPAGWCLRILLESSAWSSTIVHLKWTTRRIRRQTSEIWVQRPTKLLSEQGEDYWMRLWSRSRVKITKYGLTYIQLVPSTPRTGGIESSLWRTPDASVTTGGAANAEDRAAQGHAIGLHDQVNTPSMWPTPRGSDGEKGGPKQKHGDGTPALASLTAMYPTPQAGANNPAAHNAMSGDFKTRLAEVTGEPPSGQLNPTWVEGLMGFPHGWTDIAGED